MDDRILRRLDCLSKKQLLAAIRAITDGCNVSSPAVAALTAYLDSLPPPPGSSKGETSTAAGADKINCAPDESAVEKKEEKGFDLNKYRTRHIAFQIQYDGTPYLGFASQDLEETVENHLFNALTKLKLIEDRKTCNYSRCGRTDKGVSALGQVVALHVRSAIPRDLPEHLMQLLSRPADKVTITVPVDAEGGNSGNGKSGGKGKVSKKGKSGDSNTEPTDPSNNTNPTTSTPATREKVVQEMDYVTMLNRTLPPDIRVLAWAPVTEAFSARFSATHRTYRYFFLRKGLDIPAMQAAAAHLLGEHDFRNLCKLDIGNVSNFKREIYSAEILPFRPFEGAGVQQHDGLVEGPDMMYMLQISGVAFLWHMVRAIMAVLFMVGEGLEAPSIVQQLLDVKTCQGKPPYALAAEQPLVLHHCGFERLALPLQPRHLWQLTAHYREVYEGHLISAARAANSLQFLLSSEVSTVEVREFTEGLRQQQEQRRSAKSGREEGVGEESSSSGSHKRKLEALSPTQQALANPQQEEGGAALRWGQVLGELEKAAGLVPRTKFVPHVPLMQRKREDSYEVRVANLAGNKKERLDRHIGLSVAAAASGATPQFFTNMRQQGSLS